MSSARLEATGLRRHRALRFHQRWTMLPVDTLYRLRSTFLWASAPFPTSHLPRYRDLKLSATLPAPIIHPPSPWEVTWRPRRCSTLSSCTLFWGSAHLFPTSTPPPSPSPHKWINSYPQTSLKIPSPGCRLFSQGPDQKRPRAACVEGGTFILMRSLEFTMQERWGRQHVLFTINTSRP